jgi:hypothetical protein
VTMVARGTLQNNQRILPCFNGERYHPLKKGLSIALDVDYDSRGGNPIVVSWAPVSN